MSDKTSPREASASKKVWTENGTVGRSDIDVHTYKSMQNPKYGDDRDLFLVFCKDFFIFSGNPQ